MSRWVRAGRAAALALLVVAGAGAAAAQTLVPLPGQATAPAAAEAPAPAAERSESQTLIEILKDDAARGRLIARLEGASEAAGPEAAADAAAPTATRPLIADRLVGRASDLVRDLEHGVERDAIAVRATLRRLRGLGAIDRDAAAAILPRLAVVAVVSLVVAIGGRAATLPVHRRIGHAAAEGSLLLKAGLAALSVLLDAAVVLAAVVAATIAGNLAGGELTPEARSYLGAFLLSGWLIVLVRAVFSPASRELRPLRMGATTARSWTRHLGIVIVLVVFGEVFVAQFLTEIATPITARASLVTIYILAIAYLIVLVIRRRRAPAEYFQQRAAELDDDIGLMLLASVVPYWHFVAVAYLLFLGHHALTTSRSGVPILLDTANLAAAFGATLLIIGLLNRLADQGVRLSERMRRSFPTMEDRLNAFAPAFFRLLRYVVLVLWLVLLFQTLGVIRLGDWFEGRFGVDFLGAAASLVLVVLAGFVAWLVLASWVDYRLAPHHGHEPTARQRTLLSLARNAGLIAILILGLTYGLSEIGVSVAPLLASAGVVGLAIGFGSQKLVQDIINGLFIQFENAINVGDVVEVAGRTGSVEKLTIRSVSLRDVQGVFHVIPFSSVNSVSNYMKGFSFHVADVSIAYREDIDAAKAVMLAAYDDLMADITWETKLVGGIEWFGVQELTSSAVILRARLKTRPGEQWAIGRAYTELVKKRLDAAGIEIPFPQQTLWFGTMRDGSAAPMRLALERRAPARPPGPDARPTASRQTRAEGTPTDADGDDD